MGDDYSIGLPDRGDNRLPIKRRERAKIDNFHGDTFAFEVRRGNFGAMNHGAVRDDANVVAFPHDTSAPKWNGVIRAGVGRAVVRLAIQMLVFQEQHGVIATNRRPQHAAYGSSAVDGITTRIPGVCVKSTSPLWL